MKILLLAILFFSIVVFAESVQAEPRINLGRNPLQDLPSYDWTKEPWTGSDKSFGQIRRNVESLVARTPKARLNSVVQRYKNLALRKPNDAQVQFSWGYAIYEATNKGLELKQRYFAYQDIAFALHKARSPRSYQYARLRFLLIMKWRSYQPKVRDLAVRLVRRNPNDYDVKYYARRALNTAISSQDREISLAYAKDLVKMQPKRHSAHFAIASAYTDMCIYGNDIAAGDKAIKLYNKALKMHTPEPDVLRGIQHWMKRIREHQAELRQKN